MTDKELQEVRKRYNVLTLEKNRLELVKKKIKRLEQYPKVQEYLASMEFIKNYNSANSEEKFYDDFSEIVKKTEESNKILFSYGYCSMWIRNSEHITKLYIYRDLETEEYYYLTPTDNIEKLPFRYSFIPMGDKEQQHYLQKNKEFANLRKCFLDEIINRTQEEVVEELLQNNKQLVKLK